MSPTGMHAKTGQLIERLMKQVERLHLEYEVGAWGEPNPLPIVTLTCSPEVASLVEKFPQVEDVYRDDEPSLGIVDGGPPVKMTVPRAGE